MATTKHFGLQALATCLTICQLTVGTEAFAASRYVAQNETPTTMSDGSIQMEVPKTRPSTRLTHSPIILIPGAGTFAIEASAGGSTGSTQAKIREVGLVTDLTITSQSTEGKIQAKYGLASFAHLFASFDYGASESRSEALSTTSVSKASGYSEPTVGAGLHGTLGKTLFSAVVSHSISLGASQRKELSNSNSDGDRLSGGGSTTPQLAVLSDLGPVRLIGLVSYEIKDARKVETDVRASTQTFGASAFSASSTRPTTQTTTGGNTTGFALGIELPRAYNLGLVGVSAKSESTSTKSTYSGSEYTSSGSTLAGAMAYAAIPMIEKARLVPRLTYMTLLDSSTNTMTVNKSDYWGITLGAQILF